MDFSPIAPYVIVEPEDIGEGPDWILQVLLICLRTILFKKGFANAEYVLMVMSEVRTAL